MTVYLIKLSQPFNKKVFPHPLAFKHCITEMKCIAEVFFFRTLDLQWAQSSKGLFENL